MNNIIKAYDILSTEAKELYLGSTVAEIDYIPSSLSFHRNYVSKNVPLILRNVNKYWPAIQKWSSNYFSQLLGEKPVTVAVTPNGYADGLASSEENIQGNNIANDYFVMPEERKMKFNQFLQALDEQDSSEILYIQRQNSNLSLDFPELSADVPAEITWASEAFDKLPDAINFWMGDSRAVTSMHKDPYENIYCVISGYKDFLLIPPTDMQYVPRSIYPVGTYEKVDDKFIIKPVRKQNENLSECLHSNTISESNTNISWVSIDPLKPDLEKYPQFAKCNIYKVRVNAGDALYLPSLWYHHVQQSHKCIAVNYWYDMEYDARYCYYKMVEHMCGFDLLS